MAAAYAVVFAGTARRVADRLDRERLVGRHEVEPFPRRRVVELVGLIEQDELPRPQAGRNVAGRRQVKCDDAAAVDREDRRRSAARRDVADAQQIAAMGRRSVGQRLAAVRRPAIDCQGRLEAFDRIAACSRGVRRAPGLCNRDGDEPRASADASSSSRSGVVPASAARGRSSLQHLLGEPGRKMVGRDCLVGCRERVEPVAQLRVGAQLLFDDSISSGGSSRSGIAPASHQARVVHARRSSSISFMRCRSRRSRFRTPDTDRRVSRATSS
jgi:hypothetical protein